MRSVFTRGMVSAVAAVACAAGASSASAGQLWVGTRNPATGLITVRTAGLKPTFADGTPVGAFSIREVKNGVVTNAVIK